ncbi:TIGR02452 family protein [Actinoplanes sp. NPDC051513]|uniref:TIGR02452 family protein n=1 Tax=Actinoplanes sp. NPDC051513 TaxID=3363908 RepID=UPI0037AE5454
MSSRLRAIARDTMDIVERGGYGDVAIGQQVADAVAGTRLYLPGDSVAAGTTRTATVEVTGESTLEASRRLGGDVAALVFASARSPGGGFLNGAQAQEESVARASALYHSLRAAEEFYTYHRAHADLTYSDRVIYSPRVPVFRDDRGKLLAAPYVVSFLTAAAPNRAAMVTSQPQHLHSVPGILRRRAARVLAVAAAHGHRRLVLGAWGCGVFGNDADEVAEAFAGAIGECPWFEHITFAVLDKQDAFRRLATT